MLKLVTLLYLLAVNVAVFHPQLAQAQDGNDIFAADDDDLNIGGDIFTDFNEDTENSKVVEDERFYRFGRFFSFNAGIGHTFFDKTRGFAYSNYLPSYHLSFTFFKDFQSALNLGVEYSKHSFFLRTATNVAKSFSVPGMVDVNMLRFFLGYRYYIETSNLGTAITYSNPHLIGRFEYWYQSNKFIDQSTLPTLTGGGVGFGLGMGLEFPIELKESYWGLEFLFHSVNFFDKNTNLYQAIDSAQAAYGYNDMKGDAFSLFVYYSFSW